MKKIISLFQRNYDGDRLVRDELVPGAEWVANGEGVATQKFDGTCCMVRDGKLYKRYDAKAGKTPPEGFEPAQDPDPVTGHWPGWLLVGSGPDDKWHQSVGFIRLADGAYPAKFSGTDHLCYFLTSWHVVPDGTYELCGPRIQGNPEGFDDYVLVAHGCVELPECPRDFDGIKAYLESHEMEGIVWWRNDLRDCDKVKIKAKDFGIKWGGK